MKRISLILFFASTLYGTEFNPWFSPLWEFQSTCGYSYTHGKRVESPKGNFDDPSTNHSAHFGLGITPWPYWNGEIELYLTRTSEIPFSYEAALATLRYEWLDDIRGDPFALVTGVTLSFPGKRYLHSYYYPYHGEANAEFHATVGREWWWMRAYLLGGWGIAHRGESWLHGIAALEISPSPLQWGLLIEGLFGLGPHNLILENPFEGYALIAHRTVDIGSYISYQVGCLGKLYLLGWYNLYAHNFVEHEWSLGTRLEIPFSL